MKTLLRNSLVIFLLSLILTGCSGSITSDIEEKSSISGQVVDNSNGQKISQTLIRLCPCGTSCNSNTAGEFNFTSLEPGKTYKLKACHLDYKEDSLTVILKKGETLRPILRLNKITPALAVSVDSLNFGIQNETLYFNISNITRNELNWFIIESCNWISSIEPASGTCLPGVISQVKVVINRNNLNVGENVYQLQISSNGGNKTINVSAFRENNGGDDKF